MAGEPAPIPPRLKSAPDTLYATAPPNRAVSQPAPSTHVETGPTPCCKEIVRLSAKAVAGINASTNAAAAPTTSNTLLLIIVAPLRAEKNIESPGSGHPYCRRFRLTLPPCLPASSVPCPVMRRNQIPKGATCLVPELERENLPRLVECPRLSRSHRR